MPFTRSNSPSPPRGLLQLSDSPHSGTVETYNLQGNKEDNTLSQFTSSSPPAAPPSPSAFIKKEKHPPEKFSDINLPSVDKYIAENSGETDVPLKEESSTPKSRDEQSTFAEPVIVSTSITTTHVKDLHELCQSHVRLTPLFEFQQRKPQEFSVVLKLVGPEGIKEIIADGPYPSKRHAKEVASGLGIKYVRDLPKNEGLKSITLETPEKDQENWVALLSDLCNSRKIRPQYIDYAMAGAGFSCEVRLGAELGYPGVEEKVFGDKHKPFKNKRSAKIAAAKAAILWTREQSLPSSVSSSVGGSKKSGRSMGSTSGGNLIFPIGATPAQIVNLACPRLGIMTPEYHLTADGRTPGMYDIKAIIRRPKEPKDIMIGPLKSVFGKKKAREEMARGVYNWVKREAERQGLGMIEAGAET